MQDTDFKENCKSEVMRYECDEIYRLYWENKCQYIMYVLVDEDDTDFIKIFESRILSTASKKKWWGTNSGAKHKIYRVKSSKDIFKYLSQFETFCKYTISSYEDIVEYTDFGINDIAFLDDSEMPLLYTTTHEEYITIRNDLFE